MAFIGNVFSVAFTAVNATGVAKEIFDVVASTASRFKVSALYINKTTIGSSEGMAVAVYRGSTLPSSGGAANTPVSYDTRSSSTASFTAITNSTTPGSSGASAKLLFASALNDYTPIAWVPVYDETRDDRPIIGTAGSSSPLGERLQVRMGASAASVGINGTLILEEIGMT